jgi:hypothetical protein
VVGEAVQRRHLAAHLVRAGLVLLLLAPWIVNGVTALQGRLARAMLGSG